MPEDVGHTSPVNVCTRTGTLVSQPAIIHNSPAFGVIECTIVGLSLRNALTILTNDFKSFHKDICLSIGTARVLTPSRQATNSKSSPGDDNATTSNLLSNSLKIPLQNELSDIGTVVALIIFIFFFTYAVF